MSAFVVSHAHIDALLSFANLKKMTDHLGYLVNHGTEKVSLTTLGRILLAENERSVLHRYPDCTEADMPGTIGEEAITYKFRQWQNVFKMNYTQLCVTIIKQCDCFDYQACENDDYEDSIAAQIIRHIRGRAVRGLPGYDDAPWGINDHGPLKTAA